MRIRSMADHNSKARHGLVLNVFVVFASLVGVIFCGFMVYYVSAENSGDFGLKNLFWLALALMFSVCALVGAARTRKGDDA
jgi:hypothetical protein